jgi:fatty acid desaturase
MNTMQNFFYSFAYGMTSFSWDVVHNRTHHRFHNEPHRDITSTHSVGDQITCKSILLYPLKNIIPFIHFQIKYFLNKSVTDKKYYYALELIFLFTLYGLLLWINVTKAIYVVFIPQLLAIFSLSTFNYVQHVQTDHRHIFLCTRNFTGPLLNYFLFNAGFHAVHHLEPGLHWSLLTKAHIKFQKKIKDELVEKSFWHYLMKKLKF